MRFLKTPIYQLYLLQLENYELRRYMKLLWNKGLFQKGELRKSLIWTGKAKSVFMVACFLYLALPLFLFRLFVGEFSEFGIWNYELWGKLLVSYCLLFFLFYIFYTVAIVLLWPLDFVLKQTIVRQAKHKILNLRSSTKIIAIAGSYGKTTMKEVVKQVLSVKYEVLSTAESVNTPVGIARFILKEVSDETPPHSVALGAGQNLSPERVEGKREKVLILEMGEHYKGDIKELCDIAQPDVCIVTGIDEAHMERLGSLEDIAETIFEVTRNAKKNATVYLNADDANILKNYKKYVFSTQKVVEYSKNSFQSKDFIVSSVSWDLVHETVGKFNFKLLGEYGAGDADCAIRVAKSLGLSEAQVRQGLETVTPVSHRLEPRLSPGNILVIDDAYNGNSEGVKEAIELLKRFIDRRRVFITPGLVETGLVAKDVHIQIGRQLATAVDVVILIKNSVTTYIAEGVLSMSSSWPPSRDPEIKSPEIVYFNSAPEAHAALKNILKPGDVILFQNDWGDQYL